MIEAPAGGHCALIRPAHNNRHCGKLPCLIHIVLPVNIGDVRKALLSATAALALAVATGENDASRVQRGL